MYCYFKYSMFFNTFWTFFCSPGDLTNFLFAILIYFFLFLPTSSLCHEHLLVKFQSC